LTGRAKDACPPCYTKTKILSCIKQDLVIFSLNIFTMEEMEVPTEQLQDTIQEKAAEARERWTLNVALSTAFMAVLAAIAGLLSGHHANEAVIDQVKASDQWGYYQAKSIKSEIAASTATLLAAMPGKQVPAETAQAKERYEKEKEDIKKQAEASEQSSEKHLSTHVTLSKSVTIFQIAIAISAIAILTRRKMLWYASIVLTLVGSVFLLMGVLS